MLTMLDGHHTTTKPANLPADKPTFRGRYRGGGITSKAGIIAGGTAINTTVGDCINVSASMDNLGSGTAHNNMPPWRSAYMWYRSA